MKKFLTVLIVMMMAFSFAGCEPKKPQPDEGAKAALEEFYKKMKYDEGRWVSMLQQHNYYIEFTKENDTYGVNLIDWNMDLEPGKDKETIKYEAVDVSYDETTKVYQLRLMEEGLQNVNFILHVGAKNLDKDEIYAEIIFMGEEKGYYTFEKNGSETVNKEEDDFFKLMKEDQGMWCTSIGDRDFYICFHKENGKHMVSLIEFDYGYYQYEDVLHEAVKVSYDQNTRTYTVDLMEEGIDIVNYILHVNATKIKDNIIIAENIHDGDQKTEYIFREKDGIRWYMWKNEEIDSYFPTLRLLPDGGFSFTENVYEGFVTVTGTYTENDTEIVCKVIDKEDIKGFTGYNVNDYIFEKTADGNLILRTDICMSRIGCKFIKIMY